MMRLVFLDFDGVLHPVPTRAGESLPFEWVLDLAELLSDAPDVMIAVHSSWVASYPLEMLRDFLGPLGHRLIGGVGPGPKASSIVDFLNLRSDVQDWLVIDDQQGEFPMDFPGVVLICDGARGISDPAVQDQLRRWLADTGG